MRKRKKESRLERVANKATIWVGTTQSITVHTVLFILTLASTPLIGLTNMLLILTTLVSLEAIYLAIFIQMSVNRHDIWIKDIGADIDDIQEDVEDIQEDLEDFAESDFPLLTKNEEK